MKPVLIFPKGTLNPKDRERLSKAGYIGIESDDPKSVVLTIPGIPVISDNDMVSALMNAISGGGSGGERERFALALINLWKEKAKDFKNP